MQFNHKKDFDLSMPKKSRTRFSEPGGGEGVKRKKEERGKE